MDSIGDRIKNKRTDLNLTLQQLKEITGISSGNLSLLEKNKVQPSTNALISLSKAFECSVDWIIFGDDSLNLKQNASNSVTDESLKIIIENWDKLSEKQKGKAEQFILDMVSMDKTNTDHKKDTDLRKEA